MSKTLSKAWEGFEGFVNRQQLVDNTPETVLVSNAIALFILGNLGNCLELNISSESMDCPSDLTSATMCQT